MPKPILSAMKKVSVGQTPRSRIVRRMIGWVAIAIGAVLALGVVGLILVLHTTPPPVIHIDPAAAQRLADEMQRAQTAAAAGSPGVVRADETELNSTLDEYLRRANRKPPMSGGGVVRDMKLTLVEDRLRLYVVTTVQGEDITVVIEGKLHTVNGYLNFEPLNGKIGALPIPKASLKRALDQMSATPENREFMRLPSNLRDLHVEDGKIVVTYK